jgi:hypothetical protein
MIRAPRRARWALSFADLCLLLLGFFVLLQAHSKRDSALAGINAYFRDGGTGARAIDADIPGTMLFVPNEAMLTPAGRARRGSIARDVLESGGVLRISSQGTDPGTARFDGWDLASARLGAVARALIQAGFPANRVRIEGPDSDFVQGGKAQTLMIRSEPAPR